MLTGGAQSDGGGGSMGEQTVISATCCTISSVDPSDCNPTWDMNCVAKLCGQSEKGSQCCFEGNKASCLCKQHELFAQTLVGNTPEEEVCCIAYHKEVNMVKPLCLSAERPCCKGYSDGCCCQSRYACPCDDDVPGMCAMYALKCCDCAPFKFDFQPCVKLPPLSKDAQASAIEVEEAKMTEEFLICAGCCCLFTMYIPGSYTDAFGCTDDSLCCGCIDNGCQACMLPANKHENVLLLCNSGQGRVISPPIAKGGPFCKGVTRTFFTVTKFALPCDKEVPCVCAVCGYKCFERTIHGQMQWGDDKKRDPQTGKTPLFAKIVTLQAASVKAVASAKVPDQMDRA